MSRDVATIVGRLDALQATLSGLHADIAHVTAAPETAVGDALRAVESASAHLATAARRLQKSGDK